MIRHTKRKVLPFALNVVLSPFLKNNFLLLNTGYCIIKAAFVIYIYMEGRYMKVYYRTFQFVFNIGARFLKWKRPEIIKGEGALENVPEILLKEEKKKPLIVCGPHIRLSLVPELLSYLDEKKISCLILSYVKLFFI